MVSLAAFFLFFIHTTFNDKGIIPDIIVFSQCITNLLCGVFIIYTTSWVLINQAPPQLDTSLLVKKIYGIKGIAEVKNFYCYCISDRTVAA